MAAYAALLSLKYIIDQLQSHPSPPISLDKEQVESLTEIVAILLEFLERYDSPFCDSDEADPLEMRIADAAYKAEDVIESEIVDRIHPSQRRLTIHQKMKSFMKFLLGLCKCEALGQNLYQDVQRVIRKMDLIKEEVMEIKRERAAVSAEPHGGGIIRSSSFTEKNRVMTVGFDDVLLQLLDKLTGEPRYRLVILITGMGGLGKTTLARSIFHNALIKQHFDICVWVTISQQYNLKEIICEILVQLTGEKSEAGKKSEQELIQELHRYLFGRRYLIIMDNIWSIDLCEKMNSIFGDRNNGSRIIVTTRQSYLSSHFTDSYSLNMEFLDEVNSWNLFSRTVFGGKRFPPQLETIGKKIVKNCRGLPLSIVVIGGLLAKSNLTEEYWVHIQQKLSSVVNMENDQYCLKILKMSYNHLPVYLKPCFLYMGVFEEDCAIRVSTLIRLWVSEGFLKPVSDKSLETVAEEYLNDLVDRNIVLVHELGSIGKIKYCKIHDLLRDLCLREASKERFYHVISQDSCQGMNNQRCIVIPSNALKEKVVNAFEPMSHARSFVNNNEQIELLPNFRLLRTLKASEKRNSQCLECSFEDVFELVNLRYLAVGIRGYSFASSINLIWNLQTLIVSSTLIFLPIEIWKIPQIRHIQFYARGVSLPHPPSADIIIMENLQTLKGVGKFKCSEEVIMRIPSIKILNLHYAYETCLHSDFYCLSNLKFLSKLEHLSISGLTRAYDFLGKLNFPHSLKKLSLDVSKDYFWEEMLKKIGSLPLLQKLKLKHGVFVTNKWETTEGQFPSLRFLEMKYIDGLKYWMMECSSHFPRLEHLHLTGRDMLEEIPSEIGNIPTLKSINLKGCNESVVMSAKNIVEEQEELQGEELLFHVRVVRWTSNGDEQRLAGPNFEVQVCDWWSELNIDNNVMCIERHAVLGLEGIGEVGGIVEEVVAGGEIREERASEVKDGIFRAHSQSIALN